MAATVAELQLANVEERPYQQAMAQACHGRNSLIVLPTGLGKTLICAMVMAGHLEDGDRVLVLAPTRPLVEQHAATFRAHLPEVEVQVVTGRTRPKDREHAWTRGHVVVATPQVARNDLLTGKLAPGAWGLLVVDEAHRAVGNYAAVDVADQLTQAGARVLAATASPGAEAEKVQELCENLGIQHIEARGPWDEDVRPYVDDVQVDWVRVALPNTLDEAATRLRKVAEAATGKLRRMGHYPSRFTNRRQLLEARAKLQRSVDGSAAKTTSRALSQVGRALRVLHGAELVQTQSVAAARTYLARIQDEDPVLAADPKLKDAVRLLDRFHGEHPKMRRCARELRDHLAGDPEARALVFTKYRDTAHHLVQALSPLDGIEPALFVGQSGADGLSQQEQVARLEAFREGEHNVLVATSVGEEGLDVPSVGLVVFYEPVASPVRQIQRRGRTGRGNGGRVVLLIAQGTRDEGIYQKAAKQEKRMRSLVRRLNERPRPRSKPRIRPNPSARSSAASGKRSEQGAGEDDRPRVLVDHRELNGPLARLVHREGVALEPQTLPVGDLILSNRVAVERKEAGDFCRSILDGRLMEQARLLKRNFEAPILLIEGDPEAARGGIRKEAVAGAIATLTARFGITVLTVPTVQRAAELVAAMARKEQEEDQGPPKLRYGSSGRTPEEQQRYLLEGLPQVSGTLATRLVDHFGSPAKVFAADQQALRKVKGIGPTTARAIHEVLHARGEPPCQDDGSRSTRAQAPTTASGTGPKRSGS